MNYEPILPIIDSSPLSFGVRWNAISAFLGQVKTTESTEWSNLCRMGAFTLSHRFLYGSAPSSHGPPRQIFAGKYWQSSDVETISWGSFSHRAFTEYRSRLIEFDPLTESTIFEAKLKVKDATANPSASGFGAQDIMYRISSFEL